LGGAIMMGGGAALSAFAGKMLTPASGAMPLLWIQALTGLAALISILFVIRRAKNLGLN
jgi:DHA1 family bicyclomycin/chloramphenicol resistance-like MFS transporter